MEIGFVGKSVVVTGAGHGFGRAIAHAFCARGAVTWACDINDTGLEATAAEAKPSAGGRLTTSHVDVTDRKAVGAFWPCLAAISAMMAICASISVLRLRTARSRQMPLCDFADLRLCTTISSKERAMRAASVLCMKAPGSQPLKPSGVIRSACATAMISRQSGI